MLGERAMKSSTDLYGLSFVGAGFLITFCGTKEICLEWYLVIERSASLTNNVGMIN